MARTIRCYINQALLSGSSTTLDAASSHHLCRVLRLRVGDTLEVFDGLGSAYNAHLSNANTKGATIEVLDQTAIPQPINCPIYIAMSLIKPDRFDWMVQKAVELGVAGIIPLETAYCSIKLSPAQAQKKAEHWNNIIIHAAEQSGQNKLPTLAPLIPFKNWLKEQGTPPSPCLFLDTEAPHTGEPSLKQPPRITLLIGPEGGFHPEERQDCLTQGLIPWYLGSRTLRAETAAIAGLTLIQAKFGDLYT